MWASDAVLSAVATAPGGDGLSAASILGLGLFFGLRHALDVDHVAAVWAIVSENRSLRGSSRIGLLWGVGHTLALLVAGVLVMVLDVGISPGLAQVLELGVAAVLVALGANVLLQVLRGGHVHVHTHRHGDHLHVHPHLHHGAPEHPADTHHVGRVGVRPLLVGLLHGGAGSAALMLLVLSTIPSPWLGFVYIGVFGIGSIGGMLAMSLLVGLPAQMTPVRFGRIHFAVRVAAGVFSIGVGLFMAYEIGTHGWT